MADEVEYRCFIGGLSWSTSDRGLKEAFEKFGHLVEAKVSDLFLLCLLFCNPFLADNRFNPFSCNTVLPFIFIFLFRIEIVCHWVFRFSPVTLSLFVIRKKKREKELLR